MQQTMKILVIGGGIAGLTAASRLATARHEVTLLEREPGLRTEGYMIDFFGPGIDVAERMGLLAALAAVHYPVSELVFVDGRSRVRAAIDYPRVRRSVFHDRHFNFMRGDLERVLFEHLSPHVERRFGASPETIVLDGDVVHVEDTAGRRERYDLVVGADGVRSTTRRLAMSRESVVMRYLGCHTAAFILTGVPEELQRDALVTLAEKDIDVGAYPIRGGRTATFFLDRAARPLEDRSEAACREELEGAFRGRGWIIDQLLDAFPGDGDVYFDDVVQVEAERWSRGRVVLIGDACGAVSLVAGQGASMAMTAGYVLAEEIADGRGDVEQALARYEARIRPPVEARQQRARRNVRWFLPRSHLRAVLRDRVTDWLMRSPLAPMLGRRLGGTSIDLR